MSTSYHEPVSELSMECRDIHRAIASLIEELEAVDWYHQRADVTPDDDLKAILLHNRDEEIEHAAMALEWIRRRIPKFDEELRTYLFTSGLITEIEEADEGGDDPADSQEEDAGSAETRSDLGIGRFQKDTQSNSRKRGG